MITEALGKPSSDFDPTGREQYVPTLSNAGYVERQEFANADLSQGYWCATCPYFRKVELKSPTGSWCEKLAVPDRPWGCCDFWEWVETSNGT
jgi:hypothetical protein